MSEIIPNSAALSFDDLPTSALAEVLSSSSSRQLLRMFRDPRALENHERADLIRQLRQAVDLAPQLAEVRVLLGMALCVDLQAQEALEVLRIAACQAPDSFIARLKYGELLMRLRIMDQAAEETHNAAVLASNAAQSELARRQAATIRTMQREGIERGGYRGFLSRLLPTRRKSANRNPETAIVRTT
jgi:tetratricopeptide (TPR) repeat protein